MKNKTSFGAAGTQHRAHGWTVDLKFIRAFGFAALGAFAFAPTLLPAAPSRANVRFEASIKTVPTAAPTGQAMRVRDQLTESESAASLDFMISLRMRNFDRFEAIVQSGRTVAQAEMEANYLPLKADYDRVVAWLAEQGFAPTLVDRNHTNIFVRGTVAKIATALDVAFARVATSDGEFTSAVTAPSLPAEFASEVLDVGGLQPHLQLHAVTTDQGSAAALFSHPTRAIPADILAAYHVPANLDGTGQTIAIVTLGEPLPLTTDLATFYQIAGLTKIPADYTVVPIHGGPPPPSSSAPFEASMDAEWSSGIAPGAKLMIYATASGGIPELIAACTQILNDGVAKVVSNSNSGLESGFAPATLQSNSQVFAQMAAAGITVLHGDGDNGSSNGVYYPASDPYVAGFSGTALSFDANWNATSEVVWPNAGGGISTVFSRPAWQTGTGVPAGTMRCVPDAGSVSSAIAAAGPTFPVTVFYAKQYGVGGSSLTGPVWAGLIAIINQARANAGLPTVGLLGPKIYPLIGTNAFNDITSGTNGTYSAGVGYDLCTGVGSPNVAALIQVLLNTPTILFQPGSQVVTGGGTAVFNATVAGNPAPSYRWFLNGIEIAGATRPTLVVKQVSAADAGVYTYAASNAVGSVTSAPATLAISATSDFGRLINLSILTDISTGVPDFTVGTVIGGAGTTGNKSLLVRAGGPSLARLGVGGALADPKLEFFSGQAMVAADDNWNGDPSLVGAFTRVGAFAFDSATSKDSALLFPTLAPGGYTVHVSGVGGSTGTVIAELYDATVPAEFTATTPRLTNVSVLKQVSAGTTLTAGFVVAGSTSKTVLIRAIGPALGLPPFNIPGTMADPQLTLFNGNSVAIATNNDWGGDPELVAAGTRVGAFAIGNSASKDAMLLATLSPGSYTTQVSGAGGGSGYVLLEVYEVP